MNIGKTGLEGEKRVAGFLRKKGFTVVKQNYTCKYGEIDIIAQTPEYILFVEVKTRNKDSFVSGIEAVDGFKQNRILKTAQDFLSKTDCELQPRFDVAEVTVFEKEDGTTGYKLHYITNAF